MARPTRGVRGILLRPDDRVVSLVALKDDGDLLTVTARGYGKRTALSEYRLQSRGGKGIINFKVSEKTGHVVGVRQVEGDEGLLLITHGGQLIRIGLEDIRTIGRATQGVRVMNLGDEDRLVALALIREREEEESETEDESVDRDDTKDGESEAPEASSEPVDPEDPESDAE